MSMEACPAFPGIRWTIARGRTLQQACSPSACLPHLLQGRRRPIRRGRRRRSGRAPFRDSRVSNFPFRMEHPGRELASPPPTPATAGSWFGRSALSASLPRYLAILSSTLILSFVNYTGLTDCCGVRYTAVCLFVISLSPFAVLSLISIPKIDPSRWISLRKDGVKRDWRLFLNTLNFWDNASTLAGEVQQPQKTFPRALFCAGILTCLGYLIPLLGPPL